MPYYKVYCITQGGWQYVTSDTVPTACPTDGAHTINSTSIVDILLLHQVYVPIKIDLVKTSTYFTVATFQYLGSSGTHAITSFKIISYINTGTGSYSVRVYNKTNSTVIAEKTFTNVTQTLNDMGTVANIPSAFAIIEVQFKKVSGSPASNGIVIDNISYYG